MKYIFTLLFLSINLFTTAQTQKDAIRFQQNLNRQYSTKSTSPLRSEQIRFFKELPFFSWKKEYIVMANLELTPKASLFTIETNTDRNPLYQQYAIATFILNGQKEELRIYQSQESKFSMEYKDHLFLPFKDASNGEDSYEAGRYIDVYISNIINNQIVIDFNKAYNPYCAYNKKYSCPIPPKENHLNSTIPAGVKKGVTYQ
tara:strand:+ start:27925 stop:28530 length:606 start_codon:yes stop_codon:yes gene_type:complete